MSKVIVIECCRNCPSARLYDFEPFCWQTDKKIESPSETPDWCPLPDLPKREPIGVYNIQEKAQEKGWCDVYTTGYTYGWNACLDAIGGGHDEAKTD